MQDEKRGEQAAVITAVRACARARVSAAHPLLSLLPVGVSSAHLGPAFPLCLSVRCVYTSLQDELAGFTASPPLLLHPAISPISDHPLFWSELQW